MSIVMDGRRAHWLAWSCPMCIRCESPRTDGSQSTKETRPSTGASMKTGGGRAHAGTGCRGTISVAHHGPPDFAFLSDVLAFRYLNCAQPLPRAGLFAHNPEAFPLSRLMGQEGPGRRRDFLGGGVFRHSLAHRTHASAHSRQTMRCGQGRCQTCQRHRLRVRRGRFMAVNSGWLTGIMSPMICAHNSRAWRPSRPSDADGSRSTGARPPAPVASFAGLDFGLTMVAELRDRTYAECLSAHERVRPAPRRSTPAP